jgi:hypothetical protein
MSLSRDPANALPAYKKDSDLNSLRKLPEYEELLSKYDKSKSSTKDPWNIIRILAGKNFTNPKNHFGFSFNISGNKFEFFFGGPGEAGGGIYEVIECVENQGGTDIKLKFGNEESQIKMLILDDKTIRLNSIKNFDWGFTEKSMDFVRTK